MPAKPDTRPVPPVLRRLCAAGALALACLLPAAAEADLRVCNTSGSRVGVAIGYLDTQGWVTEGWWNLPPRGCETVLRGELKTRFYYIHGVDYDRGGEWTGKTVMCVRNREFSIRGFDNCLARGFDRAGFFEVDTGESQKSWTVQLTEPPR